MQKKANSKSSNDLIINKDSALTAQSIATRGRLIATAEKLFAKRGIDSVTLAEINVAAGQRNKNATHYHFGDKKGLLQAIFDKHVPGITLRREQLLDQAQTRDGYSISGVVRALLYPLAEKLFDADGGREFTRINAQLTVTHAAMFNLSSTDVFNVGPLERLQGVKSQFLSHLPAPLAQQRVTLAIGLILHGLADHSCALESAPDAVAADTELFIRHLEDCLVAVCAAPVSDASMRALEKAQQAAPRPARRSNRGGRAS